MIGNRGRSRLGVLAVMTLMALFLLGCEQQQAAGAQTGDNGLNPDWRESREPVNTDTGSTSALGFTAENPPNNQAVAAIEQAVSPSGGAGDISVGRAAYRASTGSGISGPNCGAGSRAILRGMGRPAAGVPSSGAHGYLYHGFMQNSPGWEQVSCQPQSCPYGALLVYNHNEPRCDRVAGCRYGHVEVVAADDAGNRKYCYGSCSNNPGGTVRGNFRSAWVYRGQ